MGKLKLKDRKPEISAPILDPEIIEAIHAPQRLDIRHGGFRTLLGQDNEQQQQQVGVRDLTPTYEVNHLPSYLGIACAVSGYSSYANQAGLSSGLGSRPLDDSTNTRSESNISRASASRLTSTPTPTGRGRAGNFNRYLDQDHRRPAPIVSHFKLERAKYAGAPNGGERERRELTGLMAASVSEKQLHLASGSRPGSTSPLLPPPTESGRHHGAYVGARYSPMPDPREPVPRHIPLLGVDDELEPEERLARDEHENREGRVRRVASLYSDEFPSASAGTGATTTTTTTTESVRL